MKSLQEQLLNKGLIDTDKARKLVSNKRKQSRSERKSSAGKASDTPSTPDVMSSAMSDRNAKRDRQLNRIKQQEAEQKAVAAQIKQLINTNRVDPGDGDLAFNFVIGKTVRKLEMCSMIHSQLILGHLSIVALVDGRTTRFELVPKTVAAKIAERDPELVIVDDNPERTESAQSTDQDDPYADFIVPDDLMW